MSQPSLPDQLLNTAAVVELVGRTRQRIGQLAKNGALPSVKIAGSRFYRLSDVEQWRARVARAASRSVVHKTSLPPGVDPDNRLSPREREVLDLILRGVVKRDIAARLGIKKTTYEAHTKNIRMKLGVHRVADLVARFAQLDNAK